MPCDAWLGSVWPSNHQMLLLATRVQADPLTGVGPEAARPSVHVGAAMAAQVPCSSGPATTTWAAAGRLASAAVDQAPEAHVDPLPRAGGPGAAAVQARATWGGGPSTHADVRVTTTSPWSRLTAWREDHLTQTARDQPRDQRTTDQGWWDHLAWRQRLEADDQGPGTNDQRPRTRDQGPPTRTRDQGPESGPLAASTQLTWVQGHGGVH